MFDGKLVERDGLPALVASSLLLLVAIAGLAAGVMTNRTGDLQMILSALAALWTCGVACQLIRLRPVGEWLKANAIFFFLSTSAAAASAILSKTDAPYADPLLAAIDRSLFGLDWASALTAFDGHARVTILLSHVYASLNWQPELLLAYFMLTNRCGHGWRVLSVFAGAAAVCVAIFPFVPATGGYIHFGIPHGDVPNVRMVSAWKAPEVLQGLRDGRLTDLSAGTLQGLVTMPSFHAAAATILAWGFWRSRVLRWPFLVLNILMLASAIPIGGHYVIDVVAGVLVAWLAIWIVGRDGAQRWGPRRMADRPSPALTPL